MKYSFWQKLSKPIVGLSPMDGVTDQPFRFITKKYGNPDVIYTEFTNVEGLCHGATALLKPLIFDDSQRPIIAQIFGKTPKYFRQVAILLCELGFDGIDINMGCPAKNVAASGSGAALIQKPKLAQEIILATKAGVTDFLNGQKSKNCPDLEKLLSKNKKLFNLKKYKKLEVPVSVKTRIGYEKPEIETWIPTLLETQPEIITLHGRTLKQGYGGKANWESIAKAATLVHQSDTLILGNGDVTSRTDAEIKTKKYKVDGVLIGRASFGNPFTFLKGPINQRNLIKVALEHAQIFEQTFKTQEKYSFLPMRKHLAWYIKGIKNASEIRQELMQTNSAQEVKEIFKKYKLL